jgi:hypothetical protein
MVGFAGGVIFSTGSGIGGPSCARRVTGNAARVVRKFLRFMFSPLGERDYHKEHSAIVGNSGPGVLCFTKYLTEP